MLELFKSRITAPVPTVQDGPPPIHTLYYGGTICRMKFEHRRSLRGALTESLQEVPFKKGGITESLGLDAFLHRKIEQLDETTSVYESKHKKRVLLIDEEVPTFDEGDRMYDSSKRLLFVTNGRDIHLIEVHYGYELGSFTLYTRMTAAKAAIKPLLDRAGLPTDQIRFEA